MSTTYHRAIKMDPYNAVFGQNPKITLSSLIPQEFLMKISNGVFEEDIEFLLEGGEQTNKFGQNHDVPVFNVSSKDAVLLEVMTCEKNIMQDHDILVFVTSVGAILPLFGISQSISSKLSVLNTIN